MKDELVSYRLTKLAKEKGFSCFSLEQQNEYELVVEEAYVDGELCLAGSANEEFTISDKIIEAPTQSLLQRWLREKHNIHVMVLGFINGTYWSYKVYNLSVASIESDIFPFSKSGATYEEVLEEGLYEALLLIKK